MDNARLDKIRQKSKDMRREVMRLREETYEIKRLDWCADGVEEEKEVARQMIMEQEMIYLREWINLNK